MTADMKDQGARRLALRSGLVVLGVFAVGATAAGCGGGGGSACPAGAISVSWAISDGSGGALSCAQAGATDVIVIVDGTSGRIACSALGTTSPPLAAGGHTVSAELVDGAGNVLDMVGPMNVSVGCGENVPLQTIPFMVTPPCGPAQLQLSWSLTANGAPVSCAQAGAAEVDAIIDAMEVPFTCPALSGTTPQFAAGAHSVSFELRDSSMNVLSQLPPMTLNFACGEVKNIGSVEFSLTP
jgi:hypothetical protein